MIPSNNGFLERDFSYKHEPTKTYRMNFEMSQIRGMVENQAAMKQAIYKILNTERYKYMVYSWNYGVEFIDLYGEPTSYCVPEIKRRITEALKWDNRITSVENFNFEISEHKIATTFSVKTVFGNIEISKDVEF